MCDFGDNTPDFPLRMELKDISLTLDLGAEVGAPLSLGSTARVFRARPFVGRENQDCTTLLLLLEDIARVATTSGSRTRKAASAWSSSGRVAEDKNLARPLLKADRAKRRLCHFLMLQDFASQPIYFSVVRR